MPIAPTPGVVPVPSPVPITPTTPARSASYDLGAYARAAHLMSWETAAASGADGMLGAASQGDPMRPYGVQQQQQQWRPSMQQSGYLPSGPIVAVTGPYSDTAAAAGVQHSGSNWSSQLLARVMVSTGAAATGSTAKAHC